MYLIPLATPIQSKFVSPAMNHRKHNNKHSKIRHINHFIHVKETLKTTKNYTQNPLFVRPYLSAKAEDKVGGGTHLNQAQFFFFFTDSTDREH